MKDTIEIDTPPLTDPHNEPLPSSPTTESSPAQKEAKRLVREREREERVHGRLTELSFADVMCVRNGKPDFLRANVLACVRGSRSQFDPRLGRTKSLLPPLTGDCCQTFSTLSAVLLSSLGFAVMLSECCTPSTVNYLLYISAWMHQLTATSWPSHGSRPTIRDLNASLNLHEFFPAKVCDEEFDVVFYNQAAKATDLLRQMCAPAAKRERGADAALAPVCGYVIVSGDYTVSIFSVDHDIPKSRPTGGASRYAQAWSFYICDSHATQPWSLGKASVTGLTFGVPSGRDGMASRTRGARASLPVTPVDDGLHCFSTILFTLLEEHRRGASTSPTQVPYMTWTPIRRKRSLAFVAQELKEVLDRCWLPKVLQKPAVNAEAMKFGFHPLECFMGVSPAGN